jgi:hypothetical protein
LGYEKYLAVKSREAMTYFESKDVPTKWIYWLTTVDGEPLFERATGLLTKAGDELYSRALHNLPVFWKTRAGDIMGNRRPPVAPPRPIAAPPPAPAPAVEPEVDTSSEAAPAPRRMGQAPPRQR